MIKKVLFVLVLSGSFACEKSAASQQSLVAMPGVAPFVLPSEAESVRVIQQGEGTIVYELKDNFPADTALAEVSAGLRKSDWLPLSEDLWNPGLPSSNSAGWRNFVDGTSSPKIRVYQWVGYWRNKRGDVVMHSIRYRALDAALGASPVGDGTGSVEIFTADGLRIAGIKVPAQ